MHRHKLGGTFFMVQGADLALISAQLTTRGTGTVG